MKRKHKFYSKPKRPFDKQEIIQGAELKKDFGLKNKKEIWKAEAKINSFRERAKKLVSASEKEQEILFNKLNKIGIKVNSIADVLSLEAKDLLKRRLQSVLLDKGLTNTIKQARQLITHKKVLVDNKIINIPSYIVPIELEDKITIKAVKNEKKTQKQGKAQEEKISENKEEKIQEKSENKKGINKENK